MGISLFPDQTAAAKIVSLESRPSHGEYSSWGLSQHSGFSTPPARSMKGILSDLH